MKASAYCKCGGKIEIESDRKVVEEALKWFWAKHFRQPEHGEVSSMRARYDSWWRLIDKGRE